MPWKIVSAQCRLRQNATPRKNRFFTASERILELNRGHWTIENRCHYVIDWNFDEDRSRIRTGRPRKHLPPASLCSRRYSVHLRRKIQRRSKNATVKQKYPFGIRLSTDDV